MRISDWSSDVCSSDLRKGDAIENLGALVDRFGAGPEQTAHFLRRFQVTLAIGAQQTPRIMEIGALANAGDDIVERPLFARRVKRSEEHTSELQSLMRISYAVFCLKKKTKNM